VAREGNRANIIGVPPSFPPRKVNGISVGCFLTPDTTKDVYTHPAKVAQEIATLVGEYPVDVKGFRTGQKAWLRDSTYEMTRKHFEVIRHYVQHSEWDYFQFVEIGLDRIHHGFWKYHDPQHVLYEPNSEYATVIRDYYLYLDEELGRLLELLTEDTRSSSSPTTARSGWTAGSASTSGWCSRDCWSSISIRKSHAVREAGRRLDRTKGLERGGYYARCSST
jgi:predicted AlkP superfamily phosphohydrolase/phosphomutase